MEDNESWEMLKHSHKVDKDQLLSGAEVGIPSKVSLGGDQEEDLVFEDYYLTGASQDEAEELLEKSRYRDGDDLGSFHQH